jgi:radical SAM superfamily enzyme YgiQ (UPF0313 family)
MTPESKVKAKVREVLSRHPSMYTYWPVPSGFGRTNLDVIGCFRGMYFCIETKREGGKPTLKQHKELERMASAMGKVFVIAGESSPVLAELEQWLDHLSETIRDHPHLPSDQVRRRAI